VVTLLKNLAALPWLGNALWRELSKILII